MNYLVFVPSTDDENSDSVHIYDIENETMTLVNGLVNRLESTLSALLNNHIFIVKFITYNPVTQILHLASENEIISVKDL